MKQSIVLLFLTFFITVFSFQCNFSYKSFDEIGGILYTFRLPKKTTLEDVEQIEKILTNRIAIYIKQQPKYIYDEATKQLSVGVPKSLTSKNPTLTKKLLLSSGIFRTVPQYHSTLIEKLYDIDVLTKEKPFILANGDTLETNLYELLAVENYGNISFKNADNSDTALVLQIINDTAFTALFEEEKNLMWTWEEGEESKSDLLSYDKSLWNQGVTETMIEECRIKKSDDGYYLILKLDEIGKDVFTKQTTAAAVEQKIIHFFLDDKIVFSPSVNEPITEGRLQISVKDDIEKVFFYQAVMTSGKLPFRLELIREENK